MKTSHNPITATALFIATAFIGQAITEGATKGNLPLLAFGIALALAYHLTAEPGRGDDQQEEEN